ncbi:unnamed protein product [Chrysoparadoxa australica]
MALNSRLALTIGLCYLFCGAHNVYKKRLLLLFPFPWTTVSFELGWGTMWVLVAWCSRFRESPRLSTYQKKVVAPLGMLHLAGTFATAFAMADGSLTFTHIVMSLEPLVVALLCWLLSRHQESKPALAALVPLLFGMLLAVHHQLFFKGTAFVLAMLANVIFAARGVYSKAAMQKEGMPKGGDLLAMITTMAFIGSVPFTLIVEGPQVAQGWRKAASNVGEINLLRQVFLCGITHYLYNEMAFIILGMTSPVGAGVINCIKRLVLVLSGVVSFTSDSSLTKALGAIIAIAGSIGFATVKHHENKALRPHDSEDIRKER